MTKAVAKEVLTPYHTRMQQFFQKTLWAHRFNPRITGASLLKFFPIHKTKGKKPEWQRFDSIKEVKEKLLAALRVIPTSKVEVF